MGQGWPEALREQRTELRPGRAPIPGPRTLWTTCSALGGSPAWPLPSWRKLLEMEAWGPGVGGNSRAVYCPGRGLGVRVTQGPSGQSRRAALLGATPAAAAPVSTSAAASPAPGENRKHPVTTGRAQPPRPRAIAKRQQPRYHRRFTPRRPGDARAARSALGPGRRTSALSCLAPASSRCPPSRGAASRSPRLRAAGLPPSPLGAQPHAPEAAGTRPPGRREIRTWGQGSQRSRLSRLRVSTGGPLTAFDLTGLHPPASRGRSLRARHPTAPELSAVKPTPATPSSARPQPFPTETVPAPGVPPPGQPWGRRDGVGVGPPLGRPTRLPRLTSPRPARPWKERESHRACTAPAPRTKQGKEKRAEHFMAIINQRGKSEQEK